MTDASHLNERPTSQGPRPLLIAHACNSGHALAQALAAGCDGVEADVWLEGDRLTLRHEVRLPRLPLLVDKWYVRRARGLIELPDLAREVEGRAGLFLDLKSRGERMVRAVAAAIEQLRHPFVQVSSRHWDLLDALRDALPGLSVWYSVGGRRQLAALLDRARSGRCRADGVSLRHGLLDAPLAHRLRELGLRVYAWIVPDPARGERLATLGVHGLIADQVHLWAAPPGGSLVSAPVPLRHSP